MIQRIQTLYLFLTTILPLLLIKIKTLKFISGNGTEYYLRFKGLYSAGSDLTATLIKPAWIIAVLIVGTSLTSLLTIFLFRKRKLQISLCVIGLVLSAGHIVAIVFYYSQLIRVYNAVFIPVIGVFIPVLVVILFLLAWRGIKKDDDLIKSYERLR